MMKESILHVYLNYFAHHMAVKYR